MASVPMSLVFLLEARENMRCGRRSSADIPFCFILASIGLSGSRPVLQDGSSQALLQPRMGRSAYERTEHFHFGNDVGRARPGDYAGPPRGGPHQIAS